MKNLILIIILSIPFSGFCDFIDFWTVEVNDSVVYDSREDKHSWNRVYTLKFSELKLSKSDTLKINYYTDTPCLDCNQNLLLTNLEMQKKKLYQSTGVATFEITFEDFALLISEPTLLIYFKSDQQYLRKILKIE